MLNKLTMGLAASLSPLLLAATMTVSDGVLTSAEAQQRVTVYIGGRLAAVGRTVRRFNGVSGFRNGFRNGHAVNGFRNGHATNGFRNGVRYVNGTRFVNGPRYVNGRRFVNGARFANGARFGNGARFANGRRVTVYIGGRLAAVGRTVRRSNGAVYGFRNGVAVNGFRNGYNGFRNGHAMNGFRNGRITYVNGFRNGVNGRCICR